MDHVNPPLELLLVFRDPSRKGTSVEEIFFRLSKEFKSFLPVVEVYFYDDSKSILANIIKIRRKRARVIHITSDVYFLTPFLGAAKKIISIHDVGRYVQLSGIKKLIYKWGMFIIPCRFANHITVVSEFTKVGILSIVRKKSARKVSVIQNPTPSIFKQSPKKFDAAYPVILHVGTAKHKNLEDLVEAIKDIACRLIVIGKLSDTQRQAIEQNKIQFENLYDLDYTEVYKKYEECDLVFFVSSYEGFGMPILEANAVGRPILCSRVTSLPEVAGNAALYVENLHCIDEIKSKIELLIKNDQLRTNLVRNGLVNVKRFDLQVIVQKYLDVYRSV